MTANYTPAQIAEITNYWDLKQIAETVGVPHQFVKKAELQQALIAHFEQLAAPKVEVAPTVKRRTKGYAVELANLLCKGATKAQVCAQFGWKNWNPKTSTVHKLGYAVQERQGKYYAVPAGL